MSFFGDIGHWLGSETKQLGHWLSNPVHDLEAAAGAAAIALPFLAPEILGGLGGAAGLGGLFGGGEAAAAGAAGLGDLGVAGLTAPGVGLGVLGDTAGAADLFAPGIAGAEAGAASGGDALAALGAAAPDTMAAATAGDVAAAGGGGLSDLGVAGLTAPGVGLGGDVAGAAGAPLSILPGAATVGTPTASGVPFLSSLGSSIMANPMQALGMGVGAAGIGASLLQRLTGLPYENQLKAGATQAGAVSARDQALSASLTAPMTTGILPPQWESAVQTAAQQGRDAIASKYASMGLSNSSSEAGDIAALDARIPEIRMQIAQGMAQIGVAYGQQSLAALGLQDNIYTALMDANIKQDQNLAQSIAAFAGAAGRAQAVKSS